MDELLNGIAEKAAGLPAEKKEAFAKGLRALADKMFPPPKKTEKGADGEVEAPAAGATTETAKAADVGDAIAEALAENAAVEKNFDGWPADLNA